MGHPRLEWRAPCFGEGSADAWTPLCPDTYVKETEEAPGWFVLRFRVWDEEYGDEFSCYFQRWSDKEDGVAVYVAGLQGEDEEWGPYFCPLGEAYLREVPPCLVFTCALSLDLDLQIFEAIFTTIAGNQVLHACEALPPVLCMEHLWALVMETIKDNGMLLSPNQEIRVLLEGEVVELPLEAVLWYETAPIGWLQRCA